ncbi:MAG: type II toxin-antitoxin system RelE/ParE family toxin [Candidatus Levyibacteriota bacterium]
MHQVELTASFLERLESIEAFLREADAPPHAYDALLAMLRDTVIPNLRRFPRMGRRYLDQPPQSAEAITQLAELPPGAADDLRMLGSGDYLILYAEANKSSTAYLLSIRHHRELSFDFARLWPGTGK